MYIDIGLREMVLRQQLPVDCSVLRMLGENTLERGQQRIRLAGEAFRRGVERDQGPIDEYEGVQACNPQPQVPILKARQALVKTADFFQTAYPDQGRLGGDEVAARQGAPQIAIQPETRQAGPAGELASWGDARSPPGSLRETLDPSRHKCRHRTDPNPASFLGTTRQVQDTAERQRRKETAPLSSKGRVSSWLTSGHLASAFFRELSPVQERRDISPLLG